MGVGEGFKGKGKCSGSPFSVNHLSTLRYVLIQEQYLKCIPFVLVSEFR